MKIKLLFVVIIGIVTLSIYYYTKNPNIPNNMNQRIKNDIGLYQRITKNFSDYGGTKTKYIQYQEKSALGTLDYLKTITSIDVPHIESAIIGGASMEGSEIYAPSIGISWLDDSLATTGIIIYEKTDDKINEYQLPVFERPSFRCDNLQKEYDSTNVRLRTIYTQLGNKFSLITSGLDNKPSSIEIPKDIIKKRIQVAVFDNKGNISNKVDLFFKDETKEILEKLLAGEH